MGDADDSYDFGHCSFVESCAQARTWSWAIAFGEASAGRHAAASPLYRQSRADLVGRLFFRARSATSTAACAAFAGTAYERWDCAPRHGVRDEMVVKATLLQSADRRIADHAFARRPQPAAASAELARRLAALCVSFCSTARAGCSSIPGCCSWRSVACWARGCCPVHGLSGAIIFDVHTLVYAAAFVLLGFQAIAFAVFTKFFAISEGLLPPDPTLDKLFRYITLEVGIAVGALLTIGGLALSVYSVNAWGSRHFRGARLLSHHATGDTGGVVSDAGGANDFCQLLHERSGVASVDECSGTPEWRSTLALSLAASDPALKAFLGRYAGRFGFHFSSPFPAVPCPGWTKCYLPLPRYGWSEGGPLCRRFLVPSRILPASICFTVPWFLLSGHWT